MAERWAGPPRTAHALTRAGAEVCIVAPPDSFAAKTRFKAADMLLSARAIKQRLPDIARLLAEDFQTHCVLAGDDYAFAELAQLLTRPQALTPAAIAMLARSMPDEKNAALLSSASAFILAQQGSATCPPPRTVATSSLHDAASFAKEVGYPLVLKRDGFASGLGVRICETAQALEAALAWADGQPFVLQEFIRGPVYGATVSGVRGRALAAIAFEKHRVSTVNGAASVARFDPRRDILTHARDLFETLGLNGYAGFDYMIDDAGRARIIEVNPRIMPTGHFDDCFGINLTGAFLAGIRGAPAPSVSVPLNELVALFPNEWMRDPDSRYLRTGIHDVPWHDPAVFAAMIDKALSVRMQREPDPFGDAKRAAMLRRDVMPRSALFEG